MGRVTDRRRTIRIDGDRVTSRADTLVAEEPLEIRVNGVPLAVTMRTPGDDIDLAIGFLCTEGLIADADQVRSARHCAHAGTAALVEASGGGAATAFGIGGTVGALGVGAPSGAAEHGTVPAEPQGGAGAEAPNTYNVLDVVLAPGVPMPRMDQTRNFYTTSSCGVCGKASIDAVRTRSRYPVAADPLRVTAALLSRLPDRLRAAQRVFERTGGLHAAGLFDPAGTAVYVREDVGRHNAVDKVIGAASRDGRLPLAGHVLLVSSRASFELVQKASMAGISVLAAVSAPSTLAVDLAAEVGMTVVGFLRGERMNIYCGDERIIRPVS